MEQSQKRQITGPKLEAEDIGEQNNLVAKMPEKAAAMKEKLVAWRERVGAVMPTRSQ